MHVNVSLKSDWMLILMNAESFQLLVRIITQSKEVDIHSLIGNIGGYLGLFLGKLNFPKAGFPM